MRDMKAVQRRLTYPELRLLPYDGRRYELVDGELYVNGEKTSPETDISEAEFNASPSPTEKHQRVVRNLLISMGNFTRTNKLGAVYSAPFDVVFGEKTALQPDILFISSAHRGIIGPEYVLGAPDLVAEILSASNPALDRVAKFEQYARHGVGEYWIIDPLAETVEVYRLTGSSYELKGTLSGDDKLGTPLLPGWKSSARDLFAD